MERKIDCPCTDIKCPNHPNNHNKGCDLCIIKNIKNKEIPSCFFRRAIDDVSHLSEYTFESFAREVIKSGVATSNSLIK